MHGVSSMLGLFPDGPAVDLVAIATVKSLLWPCGFTLSRDFTFLFGRDFTFVAGMYLYRWSSWLKLIGPASKEGREANLRSVYEGCEKKLPC